MVILGEMVGYLFCLKLYIIWIIKYFLDDSILYYEMQENKIVGIGVYCLKFEKN